MTTAREIDVDAPPPLTLDTLADPELVGQGAALLVADMRSWINRRVESVTFLDSSTVRRRVSVDVSPPLGTPRVSLGDRTGLLLPIALLERRVLTGFDLTSWEGHSLPMLTAEENAAVSAALVIAHARATGLADAAAERILRELVTAPPAAEEDLVAAVGHLQRLGASPNLVALTLVLAGNFLLCTVVGAEPGDRLIVKYRYTEPFVLGEGRAGERAAAALGWTATPAVLAAPAIADSASYHLEVTTPGGVHVQRAALVTVPPRGQDVEAWVDVQPGPTRAVHLHARNVPWLVDGDAVVELRVDRGGWLTAATLSAVGTAVVLWVVVPLGERLVANSAPVSLLLALNGVSATLTSRAGEHDLAAELLRGMRRVVTASAILSYTAAGLVALGVPPSRSLGVWIVLAVLASLAAVSTATAFGRSSYLRSGPAAGASGRGVEQEILLD